MSPAIIVLFFLTFAANFYTFNAQVKQCDYVTTIRTGPTRGPTYKLGALIEMRGDEDTGRQGQLIKTTNLVKNWGDMGKGYTYFLPNTRDRFRTTAPCTNRTVCFFILYGKKGELRPHWYIHNITVTTKVGEIVRDRVFTLNGDNEVTSLYPMLGDGECP
ncbi:hypothetical protein ACHQM5_009061 [Ranunculus cassubicifolius]